MRGSLVVSPPPPDPPPPPAPPTVAGVTSPQAVTGPTWTRIGTATLDASLEGAAFGAAKTTTFRALFCLSPAGVGQAEVRGLDPDGNTLFSVSTASPLPTWADDSASATASLVAIEARATLPAETALVQLVTLLRDP